MPLLKIVERQFISVVVAVQGALNDRGAYFHVRAEVIFLPEA